MRWLILTDDHLPGQGGVAVWTDRVAAGLRDAGHDVAVFARWRADLPSGVTGVRWPSFGMHGGEGMALATLGESAARVLCTTWTVVPPRWRDVDVVLHGSDVTRPTRRPRRRLRVLRRCRVWSVSNALLQHVAPWGVHGRVLPAPINIAPYPCRPAEDPLWTWAGRLVRGKGVHRFIHLVAAAGVRGRIVGDGPLMRDLQNLAERKGARVQFFGWQSGQNVRRILAQSQLVISLPETGNAEFAEEGLGLVALEAAAVGVPAVGCAVGGVPEAIGPGLLLPDPDAVEVSVAAIRSWWNPSRGREAWNAARAKHGAARTVAALACP